MTGTNKAEISIHSAARAETYSGGKDSDVMLISIHSAARAETGGIDRVVVNQKISIHSAARAETHKGGVTYGRYMDFNPLRREGGDALVYASIDLRVKISIHSAARAETQLFGRFRYF